MYTRVPLGHGVYPPFLSSKGGLKRRLGGFNSNIFYVHPYLGKWSNLTNIFQMGGNHQLVHILYIFVCVVLYPCRPYTDRSECMVYHWKNSLGWFGWWILYGKYTEYTEYVYPPENQRLEPADHLFGKEKHLNRITVFTLYIVLLFT